ncbi:transcription-repair coupling factor [Ruminococcaceae bacterium YRB3002]|nr:transcription-repair coupling factor [Ruminococcaceae bacterium YRB3002]
MNDLIRELLKRIADDAGLVEAYDKVYGPPGGTGSDTLHLNLHGMCEEQKGFILCALAARDNRKPVLIVPDVARARTARSSIAPFVNGDVVVLAPSDLTLISAVASSRDDEIDRVAALTRIASGDYGAAVIAAGALINRMTPLKDMSDSFISLKLGTVIDPSDLTQQLMENGYERVRTIAARGEFSWRGDVVDIYPPEADMPVRISFFDDEVDQIKKVDIDTQRSVDSIEETVVGPATEFIIREEDRESAAAAILVKAEQDTSKMTGREGSKVSRLLTETAHKDADAVRNLSRITGFARWLSVIMSDTCTILDYLRDDTLIAISEFQDCDSRISTYASEYALRCQEFFEVGMAPSSARDSVYEKSDIYKRIDRSLIMTMSCFGSGLPGGILCPVTGFPQENYNGRISELAQLIKRDQTRDPHNVFLCLGEGSKRDRFSEQLKEFECFPEIAGDAMGTGFTYPALGISVFGEQDVYGLDRIVKPKRKGGARLSFIGECEPGDYVVHDTYGIGRYEGLESIKSGNTQKDHLKISYAGGEYLYVAPEKMECLQKYIGPGDREPKLSKLGGDEWTRKVERARNSVRKTAYDLLKLYATRSAVEGFAHLPDTEEQKQFEEAFPYVETEDQLRAIAEVKRDMESPRVMDRLLCGDVGFGKTEVAMRAMFKCVMSGKQAVMIAPTTLLAQQHYDTFRRRAKDFPVNIVLLSRFVSSKKLKENIDLIRTGKADIIIGTHRVLSEDVKLKNPGLLVIDEEQRFGVNHKEKIKVMRQDVDVLSLSATPIPRTLHMSLSGIRDISMLEEAPLNRRPVQTFVMEYDEDVIVQACMREIGRGGQIFYLFNNVKGIDLVAQHLSEMMPGVRVIYAHGKMNEQELEQIVMDFVAGKYDILVCTTIIENGVDMPNVNTLIVENSDRFGLAQLYQIKGRVGRSDRQAYAYITYDPEKILKENAAKRLQAIREFTELGSGVKIAMRDLEVRGAGSLLGAEQHGMMETVGYELYCRMLDEEIAKLKDEGEDVTSRNVPEAAVDVDYDAYLPKNYIEHESERMVIYRKLGAISTKEEYDDFIDEVTDRYGDPPKQIFILAGVALIRHLAPQAGFAKVVIRNSGVRFLYVEGRPIDMQAMSGLMADQKVAGRVRINAVGTTELTYRPVSVQNERTIDEVVHILCVLNNQESVV